eukprot:gnl/TRDRNA2_/TRDRNA2_139982_c1_seq1.p1 gnl/TRDRNA2_/TRDRNA2_139982_c1~~gnl/TRDRNA2_/TRDRNA2_139982_c1_seq1.p1  ORF type:complete len:157 (+),score=21.93 gnl/TRDRNA2_/TRDRNA2_139982_c1_seq1:66-473(+)
MQDQLLVVPSGWEILSSKCEDFEQVMKTLTGYCWGTNTLCVRNADGGFDSYTTAVRTVSGSPGSLFQADIDWLESVGSAGREFRFRGLSGRLVIRARQQAMSAVIDSSALEEPVLPQSTMLTSTWHSDALYGGGL